ncbi:uncharacterized protein BKA55DRAFT_547301 [Fusarium redolens]|uniref:Uncharacterized protein n=1 Tax=Fusarium redolens TaxID=48865 RepID=A0A9P9FWQ2_FUSRE|nr:uncharacterized protein BKA55DRAFT_547301 [Fusarium redolens]KAH7204867.1 hypothetical protein BKA55DRAFT_547301 [Fusarium redolens]
MLLWVPPPLPSVLSLGRTGRSTGEPANTGCITRILFVVSSNLLHLTSASSATTKNEVSSKVPGSNPAISQVTIPDILLALYLLTHLLTASGQSHLFPSAMIELLLESPLPCFLASSTAYALITSHQLQCQLVPIFVASWTFALFAHLVVWQSWIFPRYVSELRHIPTVPGFPLWGQFFDIITQECGAPQQLWHHRYGPVVRYFFPFGSERLSIAERGAWRSTALKLTSETALNHHKRTLG